MSSTLLLQVKNLTQHFKLSRSFTVKAVEKVSFEINTGETYGLVGESGSGKSTIGRSIIRLYDPTDGEVFFDGKKISGTLAKSTEKMLRQNMQMIFQDPMSSLNPRKKIGDIIAEGLDIHHLYSTRTKSQGSFHLKKSRIVARSRRTLSSTILRRSTTTCRHCSRSYHESEINHCRRVYFST